MPRPITLSAILAIILLAPYRAGSAPASIDPELFGYSSRAATGLKNFPKWAMAIERHLKNDSATGLICRGNVFRNCMSGEWKDYLDSISGDERLQQIRSVHERMNRTTYRLDINNYAQSDYWASPNQFFHLDRDCEDYAIAKYFSLRALGFQEATLRIVVLDDLNLGIPHAVLVVLLDGKFYVLDNQISQVVNERVIRHYRPIYALNESGWWLYYRSTKAAQ